MSKRILWFSAIAILMLLGTGSTAPAEARGRASGFSTGRPFVSPMHARRPSIVRVPRSSIRSRFVVPGTIVQRFGVQDRFPFGIQNGFPFAAQNGFGFAGNGFGFVGNGFGFVGNAFGGWPFGGWPLLDTAPLQVPSVANETPSAPVVIVMSGLSDGAPERARPETPPDYGYVAGCHAIPNGYHCDIPHNEGTP